MTETSTPLSPDERAAHDLLSELRTRIATQPLPYQHGVEARALESLWEIFGLARKAIKANPGCAVFAHATTEMLNVVLRPVTAKWHRAHQNGLLDSKDGANAFRADLAEVRTKLRAFSTRLQIMAYGSEVRDTPTPPVLSPEAVEACFHPVEFGIAGNGRGVEIKNAAAIDAEEAREIAARREGLKGKPEDGRDAVGLALSGGGIRSATFCLGVVQVLAERGLMPYVDYLSTVSGGGYTGCFVTSIVGRGDGYEAIGHSRGPDTERVRHLRRNAKYLSAKDLKQRWLMVTGTLAGTLLNWTAPLFFLAALALVRVLLGTQVSDGVWVDVIAALGLLTAVATLAYGVTLRFGAAARFGAQVLACGLALTLASLAAFLVERGYGLFVATLDKGWGPSGLAAGLAAALPALVRFVPIFRTPAVQRRAFAVVLWLTGVAVPMIAIIGYYALRRLGESGMTQAIVLASVVAVSGLFAFLVLDVNLTGPHKLYRDGLSRTFVRRREDDAADLPLIGVNASGKAPYHLINATLNLPSSESEQLRDRRGDFFLFSKGYCGAPSIGYRRTEAWTIGGAGIDLATAMAVSGAAVSLQMGLGSLPSLSALLTLLNIRLGLWIRKPGAAGGDGRPVASIAECVADRRSGAGARPIMPSLPRPVGRARGIGLGDAPGFGCLLREMTGAFMTERSAWLNVSDGGHIENMGIYELLRRRCKFIVCVDGEADPKAMFEGHLTLVRHAQIDFGILIEPRLDELRPAERSKYSRTHAQLFRIHYNDGADGAAIGLMLYLKLSLTGDEAELLKRYRAVHPDFPHQSTLDQFYDEEQFEAYRQLGVHVAEGTFAPALMTDVPRPTTVASWFRQLAVNMLEPTGSSSGTGSVATS